MGIYAIVFRLPVEGATALLAEPEKIEDLLDDKDAPSVDVDKAWHVLHFSLTGSVWEGPDPAGFLVLGGQRIGDIDVGYGPARLFMPEQVVEIVRAVADLTDEKVLAVAQMPEARELYGGWKGPWSDSDRAYLLGHLQSLKAFMLESEGCAIVVAVR